MVGAVNVRNKMADRSKDNGAQGHKGPQRKSAKANAVHETSKGQKKNMSRRKKIAQVSQSRAPRTGLSKWLYRLLVSLIWGLIIMVFVVVYYAYDLPDISNLKAGKGRSTVMVMDREGGLLASYGDVHGEWLDYKDIPQDLVHAVIATEDRRFFSHMGIDIRGLGRAMVKNITSGRMVQGGSTISQQLAKNLFLNSDRTIKRKIQELLLSYWLELNFSKEDILTYYFNRVYFGSGAYGIDAAARTIYGHSARALSLIEAAMLAGVLKGPALYSPLRDLERSYHRTEDVLNNMVEAGFIDQNTADITKSRSVNIAPKQTGGDQRYFSDWVVDNAAQLIGPAQEPLIIYTTLMPDIQNKANKALQHQMDKEGDKYKAGQAALVSLDMDGAVRAMVGGTDYTKSQYNRVTQSQRQPGSAFKLFVYLTALEKGITPDDIMRDGPVILNGWQPKNYSGHTQGNVTIREAFAHSLNTVAVKLSERVNRNNVIKMARRLGITTPITTEPSLALGTSEVYLLELTAAYGAIANGGYRMEPYGIVEIQNSLGEILYRHMPGPPLRILSEDVVIVMDSLLKSVVSEGTARQAQMSFAVAGKTGTTQNYKDALFVGYGLNMVNGVWVGNDDATPMSHVTGGGTPARIWRNFMYRVSTGRDDAALTTPNVRPRAKPTPKSGR